VGPASALGVVRRGDRPARYARPSDFKPGGLHLPWTLNS